MFSAVSPKKTKQPKRKVTKKQQHPQPRKITQTGAPFDHIKETSPEPVQDPNEFEFDTLLDDEHEWEQEQDDRDDVSEINYDATSMTDEDDDPVVGSVSSLDFFEPRTVVTVEAKTPPGIQVSFDDESWIY